MAELFLACCVRGMEVTRHFTPELGATIALMLAFAVGVAGILLVASPLLQTRKS